MYASLYSILTDKLNDTLNRKWDHFVAFYYLYPILFGLVKVSCFKYNLSEYTLSDLYMNVS